MITQEDRIKRSHIALMKHPKTVWYASVLMMGTSSVEDKAITAYTDGVNKRYGRAFLEAICKEDAEVNALVLHENLHIVLRHILHSRDLFLENSKLANMAADYVVNGIIVNINEPNFLKLPKGGIYDPKYDNMNMREVYRALKKEGDGKGDGKGDGGKGDKKGNGSPSGDKQNSEGGEDDGGGYQFDEHDINGNPADPESGKEMTAEEAKKLDADIDRAMREGAILAGRLGLEMPREITDLLEPRIDWRKEMREFMSSFTNGKEDFTWRKFNRRYLANDMYMPSTYSESVGEIVVAIDTSGSIGQEQLSEFATELVSIAEMVSPEAIRILWWDTMVHGQQLFTEKYEQIASLLKPLGGGGTRVGCVSEYVTKYGINAECLVVFTDGYVESTINWNVPCPTLWMVTQNKHWVPPSGVKVFIEA